MTAAAPDGARATRWRRRSVLPGFGLSLGYTIAYLSLIVLIPLAGLGIRSATLGWNEFWAIAFDPRVTAALRIGAGLVTTCVADFVDTVNLKRETGGAAIVRFKTFEMGREAWQGEPVDLIWGDEDAIASLRTAPRPIPVAMAASLNGTHGS